MHEGRHLIDLLCTLHSSVRRRSPDAGALVRCAVQVQDRIGLPDSALPAAGRMDGETPLTVTEWERLGRSLALRRARSASSTSFLDTWLSRLAHMVALDKLETAILGLALAYGQDSAVERLWDELSNNRGRPSLLRADPELLGLLLGVQATAVRCCLEAEGRLRTSGLLVVDDDGDMTVLSRLYRLLARRTPLQGDVRALLLSPPREAELNWDAFRHLGEQAKAAEWVLAAAIEQREPGINILLYGPPGAGKTAFAATLADRVGASLYPVGEADSDGGEPSRGERLAELRLNQRLLGESASVLLFDEAEDLFTSMPFFEGSPHSRVFLHRLLERGRAPVIWTANDLAVLGPAIARRMALCIEIRQPSAAVSAGLWRDMARQEGVPITEADAAVLAYELPATPGILRNGQRAARLVGGDVAMARLAATGIARAVAGGNLPWPEPQVGADYDPSLVHAECDLAALARKLSRPGPTPSVSLLLYGPPGTGKSAYARHLAGMMGLPVLLRRASDLLGGLVGQSEQQIAATFGEARDSKAFLILDEADSLLGDRRSARHSWEVSQVNEMLTWMEHHPLPFACTTNLLERLDGASMRRFTFKARFDYLRPDQAASAFRQFFGMPAPANLARLSQLTPADFSLVRKRMGLLGQESSPEAYVDGLANESLGREGGRRIGFAA